MDLSRPIGVQGIGLAGRPAFGLAIAPQRRMASRAGASGSQNLASSGCGSLPLRVGQKTARRSAFAEPIRRRYNTIRKEIAAAYESGGPNLDAMMADGHVGERNALSSSFADAAQCRAALQPTLLCRELCWFDQDLGRNMQLVV